MSEPSPDGRLAWISAAVSLLPTVVAVTLLVARNRGYAPHAVALLWWTLAVLLLPRLLPPLRRRPALLLPVVVLQLLVLAPEAWMRVYDLRWESGVRFAYPRPEHFLRLERDEELFWRMPTSTPGINSLGFPGEELRSEPQAGSVRVVVLGDSVAFEGYPEIVQALLPGCVEVVNLSMVGYTSHQGRRVVELYARSLQPRLAIISYGWNDHWRAWVATDRDQEPPPAPSRVDRVVHHSRLTQLALHLGRSLGRDRGGPLDAPRVSVDDYAVNLYAMVDELAAAGSDSLLLTLPSGHRRFGTPPFFVETGFIAPQTDLPDLHSSYNRVVRRVAAQRGLPLLDLARELEPREDLGLLLREDGIHLTPIGSGVVASRLNEEIRRLLPTDLCGSTPHPFR